MHQNALANAYKKDQRQAFWSDQGPWPSDAPSYLFAGRALLKLGRHRYGSTWSDTAPATKLVYELSETLNIFTSSNEIVAASDALRRIHEPYRARSNHSFIGGMGPDFPTREEWEIARAAIKKEADETWEAYKPFVVVAYELAEAAKQGKLKTALRPLKGGNLQDQEWHFWNLEWGWWRFDNCRVDEADPYQHPMTNGGTHWLYFERGSFDAFCSGAEEAPDIPQNLKQPRQSNRRAPGRKPKYDWEAYVLELARRYACSPMPDSDYDVEAEMSDWCLDNFGEIPASSLTREKIANFRQVLSTMKAGISRE